MHVDRDGRRVTSRESATPVDAVLFDLDGTLLDHEGAARATLREAVTQWLPGLAAGERIRALDVWQRLEATHMRAYLFVPADVGAAKPSPHSFLRACATMGWDPARVLYVGDNLHTDAVAAAHAGLPGCWLDRHHSHAPPTPPGVTRITGPTALPPVLHDPDRTDVSR